MSDKTPNPEHNEGDQAEEMKEEGSPVEPASDSSVDVDSMPMPVQRFRMGKRTRLTAN